MRVLVACEFSGAVRDAFAARGHDAWSCDLEPTDPSSYFPQNHFQCKVQWVLDDGWDLMIAHPPCTHLAVSGAQWFGKKVKRQQRALEFFLELLNAPIPHICIENPVGVVSTNIRKANQIIQPWQFGDSYQKTTCLWLKNLPRLQATKIVDKGEFVSLPDGRKQPKWYANAGSGDARRKKRSRTFDGVAEAMADQWGDCQHYRTELVHFASNLVRRR